MRKNAWKCTPGFGGRSAVSKRATSAFVSRSKAPDAFMYAATFCLSSSESSADPTLLDDLPLSKKSRRNAAGCTFGSARAAFERPTTACPSICLPPDVSMYLSYSAFLLGAAM